MGTGGGGEAGGTAVKGFVSQEGEGEGFFGVYWNTEARGGEDFDAGEGG